MFNVPQRRRRHKQSQLIRNRRVTQNGDLVNSAQGELQLCEHGTKFSLTLSRSHKTKNVVSEQS